MRAVTRRTVALTVLAGALVCAAVGVGISLAPMAASRDAAATGTSDTAAPADDVVMTSFPGLVAATGEPELASMTALRPAAGSVAEASGPFDDRFEFDALSFDGATVSGAVRITSDVSDLLELEVVAGFYDVDGTLLGTDRFVHHLGDEVHDGPPVESEAFAIAVPAPLAGRVGAVAVGVPVLVNE